MNFKGINTYNLGTNRYFRTICPLPCSGVGKGTESPKINQYPPVEKLYHVNWIHEFIRQSIELGGGGGEKKYKPEILKRKVRGDYCGGGEWKQGWGWVKVMVGESEDRGWVKVREAI